MPVIATTLCRKLEDYRQAVLHTGGEVRVVDASMNPADALNGTGGLLLTGGEDVDPARYQQPRHTSVVEVDPARDEFEFALIAEAGRRQLPIFAICRGIQMLNVARGGTLVQDIPTEVAGALEHKFASPPHQPFELAHEVWVDKDTLLAQLLGDRLTDADSCEVNSRHHQAVKDVAPGFRVSATAPDGVIEAIEDPNSPFCVGVQWHPENFWRTGEFRSLFEGFLEAAAAHENRT
jgi:putative glutamine amidotransferase